MKEYQHRHVIRTLFYSPATIVILFVLLIFLLRSIMELNDKRIGVSNLKKDSEVKKEELQTRVASAQERNDAIHTSRGLEEYIRITQPVVKIGESVIVIYDAQGSPVTPVKKDMNIWEDIIIWMQKLIKK